MKHSTACGKHRNYAHFFGGGNWVRNWPKTFIFSSLILSLSSCIKDPLPSVIKQSDLQGPECATAYSYVSYHLLTPTASDCKSCKTEWKIPENTQLVEESEYGSGIMIKLGTTGGPVSVRMVSDQGIGNEVFIDLTVDNQAGTYSIQDDVMDNQFNGLENPKCFLINGIPHVAHNAHYTTSIDIYSYDHGADTWSLDYTFSGRFENIISSVIELDGKWYFIDSFLQLNRFDPQDESLTIISTLPEDAGHLIFYAHDNKLYSGLKYNTSSSPLPTQYFYSFDPVEGDWASAYEIPMELQSYGPPSAYSIMASGKVYIFIHRAAFNTADDDIFELNPTDHTARKIGSLDFSGEGLPRGLFLIDDKILAIGAVANALIDPSNGTVTPYSYSDARECPIYVNNYTNNGYFTLDGNCYFVGGTAITATKGVLRMIP